MATTATNEGRCCDAVLRILEAAHGAKRDMQSRDSQATRGIEATCIVGGQHYAIEHTLIEPFSDNQLDDIAFARVFDANFEADLADLLKPALAYTITVNVYAFLGISSKQLPAVRSALLRWARHAVPRLSEPPRGQGPPEVRIHGEPPDAPVRVTLGCHHSKALGGRLLPGRFAPEDLEHLRHARLLKALQDKGPKLHAARTNNTRTVLVAENHDFAITNEGLLSEAFDELCARVTHAPDDIYVVDTRGGATFAVTQVRRAGEACLLMGTKPGDWEFKAADLAEI
jgi:hypothetical protein